jgi:hypothetical protein
MTSDPGRHAVASRLRRVLVGCAPALAVALPALAAVWSSTVRASWASLGRDQGIFQYVAWAIANGDVAYRDVRDVNGPVVTMVHLVFLGLGGAEEHRFRVLDLLVTGATFAFAGACVPSIADPRRRPPATERALWALGAWVALSAQHLVYGFWDTAQRESFLDWFVLVAIALQATSSAAAEPRSRRAIAVLFASGALSFVPWLGKPTFALFTVSQLLAILVEDEPRRDRLRRLASFLAGGIAGSLIPIAFLLVRGDVALWARITFVDVPAMYRFIWPRPASVILSFPGYRPIAILAAATSVGLAALVFWRRLPRRAIPIAAMPVLGLASVVLQAKGFAYHFHPVTLGIAFGWIVALAATWARVTRVALRVAVVVAAVLVGIRSTMLARDAPYPAPPAPDARDAASLESPERLAAFDRIDFFPRALRDAAAYVAARTSPEDRVQTYGMDAYVLFLARRKSATPYVYAYDLNADAALVGSFDPGGVHPTPDEARRIRAMRDEHERDLLARLERRAPAAFVFVDRSPLMSDMDAVVDFATHCPDAMAWVAARYRETADFHGVRVWLRNDLAGRSASLQ